jgi:hypothetical protein
MGGVTGVIEAAVAEALAEPENHPVIPVDDKEQRRLLRDAFIPWLAEIDEQTGERQRRISLWDELPEDAHPLVERLIEKRLLIRDQRANGNDTEQEVVVEVAHEALLRRWPLLVRWLDEDEEDLKTASSVIHAAKSWAEQNLTVDNDKDWLVHLGGRLLEAERLLDRQAFKQRLGGRGRSYIQRCRQFEKEELDREKRRIEEKKLQQEKIATEQAKTKKQQWWTGGALLLFLLVLVVSIAWTVKKTRDTGQQVSLVPASASIEQFNDGDGNRALRYGILAAKDKWMAPTDPLGEIALATSTLKSKLTHILRGHGGWVRHATFSADGTQVVTASDDKTARLWEVSYFSQYHGNDLVGAVCQNWSSSVTILTPQDINIALILKGREGEDVCAGYR